MPREIQMAAMGAPWRRGEVRGGVSFDREAAEVAADGEAPRSAEDVDAGALGGAGDRGELVACSTKASRFSRTQRRGAGEAAAAARPEAVPHQTWGR